MVRGLVCYDRMSGGLLLEGLHWDQDGRDDRHGQEIVILRRGGLLVLSCMWGVSRGQALGSFAYRYVSFCFCEPRRLLPLVHC